MDHQENPYQSPQVDTVDRSADPVARGRLIFGAILASWLVIEIVLPWIWGDCYSAFGSDTDLSTAQRWPPHPTVQIR
jgi:hypothetical protein